MRPVELRATTPPIKPIDFLDLYGPLGPLGAPQNGSPDVCSTSIQVNSPRLRQLAVEPRIVMQQSLDCVHNHVGSLIYSINVRRKTTWNKSGPYMVMEQNHDFVHNHAADLFHKCAGTTSITKMVPCIVMELNQEHTHI